MQLASFHSFVLVLVCLFLPLLFLIFLFEVAFIDAVMREAIHHPRLQPRVIKHHRHTKSFPKTDLEFDFSFFLLFIYTIYFLFDQVSRTNQYIIFFSQNKYDVQISGLRNILLKLVECLRTCSLGVETC
jgi:hypothetical protein